MAWTATITKVEPSIGTLAVTVTFTEGATSFNQQFLFDAAVTKAQAMAQISASKAELIAVLDKAKAAQAFLGTVIP